MWVAMNSAPSARLIPRPWTWIGPGSVDSSRFGTAPPPSSESPRVRAAAARTTAAPPAASRPIRSQLRLVIRVHDRVALAARDQVPVDRVGTDAGDEEREREQGPEEQ